MDKIWHYTSHHAAFEIWKSKKLRMTRIDYMNDSKEQVFFLEELDKFLTNFDEKEANHIRSTIKMTHHRLWFNATHVISFSTDSDSVSQWERYGNDAKGVAICFDKSKLLTNKMQSCNFVEYKSSNQLIKEFKIFHNQHAFNYDAWIEMINERSHLIKQEHFRSESEIRISQKVDKTNISKESQFFVRDDTLCPYHDLIIPEDAIIEIKMGPKARYNAKYSWLEYTSPNFTNNNANIWRDLDDETLDIVDIQITRSSCSLI